MELETSLVWMLSRDEEVWRVKSDCRNSRCWMRPELEGWSGVLALGVEVGVGVRNPRLEWALSPWGTRRPGVNARLKTFPTRCILALKWMGQILGSLCRLRLASSLMMPGSTLLSVVHSPARRPDMVSEMISDCEIPRVSEMLMELETARVTEKLTECSELIDIEVLTDCEVLRSPETDVVFESGMSTERMADLSTAPGDTGCHTCDSDGSGCSGSSSPCCCWQQTVGEKRKQRVGAAIAVTWT